MKKFIIAAICSIMSFGALADSTHTTTGGNNTLVSQQVVGIDISNKLSTTSSAKAEAGALSLSGAYAGGSVSGATNQGNNTQVSVDTHVRPAASAPAVMLTSVGTDNCLGSASGSAGNGFFSLGIGKTIESDECNRRAYSRALRDMGLRDAAIQLLCKNEEVRSVTAECKKEETVAAE